MITIAQAIKNAIEVERAAARFYVQLQGLATDAETRRFFEGLVRQENEHARIIEQMGQKIHAGELPVSPDARVASMETAPGWDEAASIDLGEALDLALESENQAALYYDTIADCFEGALEAFFRDLSRTELQHASSIQKRMKRI